MTSRLGRWLATSAAMLAFLACSPEEKTPSAGAPEIVSFTTDREVLTAGGSATLAWQTANTASVSIVDGSGNTLELGDAEPAEGSVSVTPVESTSYELVARNADGDEARASVSLTVEAEVPQPAVTSFTAAPEEVARGGEVTLAWATTDADRVVIRDAAGAHVDLGGADAATGEVTFEAQRSTTYALTATGPGGEAFAEVAVVVHGAPTVALSAPAAPIAPGGQATLSWSVTEATSIKVHSGGTVVYEGTELTGSTTVRPTLTTTYVIEAVGPGGEAVANTQVLVKPVVSTFTANTTAPVRSGDEVELAWNVAGAEGATIDNGAGLHFAVPAAELASGTATLPVGPSGAFFLTAYSGAIATEATARVEISLAPRFVELTVTPPVVTASAEVPADVQVGWMIDGAARVLLEAIPGGVIETTGRSARKDSVTVQVSETTTFRMTAQNEFGEEIAETLATVLPAPNIDLFAVRPGLAGTGETVELAWELSHAASVRIEKDGVDLGVDPALLNGTTTDTVLVESSYVIYATNAAGFEVPSDPVVVRIGDPVILDFSAEPMVVGTGLPLTFSWENDGGQTLTITDAAGTAVCSSTSLTEIPAGSCQIAGPAPGMHEYTLHLTNGVGTEVQQPITIEATDGPIIDSLIASSDLVSVDETVTVSWEIRNDAAGAAPTLTLTDDQGNTYDVSGATTSAGSTTVSFDTAAIHTFTLTASTSGTIADSATFTVDVRGLPVVDSFVATPAIVDTQGGTVPSSTTLTWSTQHGATVSVFELDDTGTAIEPALFSSNAAADALAGSVPAAPVIPSSDYLLVIDNGVGRTAEATIAVAVDPAEILTFTASPSVQLDDQPITLSWTTLRADAVELSPPFGASTQAYTDISTWPGAVEITPSNVDDAVVTVNFPTDFAFPYDGADRTSAVVSTNGFISFRSSAANNLSNVDFPEDSGVDAEPNIAAFWDDLDGGEGPLDGTMWTASGTDAEGDFFVVQWKDWGGNAEDQIINFQIVLRDNGDFELRYGELVDVGDANQDDVNGGGATIGWQNLTGTVGYNISYNTPVAGGLSGRSWRVRLGDLPANGTIDVYADTSVVYTLTARNAHSSATANATVTIHPAVNFVSTAVAPELPTIGQPFTISWEIEDAVTVEVLDGAGNVIHTAPTDQLASGSFARTEAAEGHYDYTIRAHGGLQGNIAEQPIDVYVFQPFSIDSFVASADEIRIGEPVTLSWQTTGAASMALTANGVPVDLTGKNMVSDSITFTPTSHTHYSFSVENAPASTAPVTIAASRDVVVATTWFESVTQPTGQIPAGGSTTITWDTTGGDYVTVTPSTSLGMTEVTAGAAYLDVSSMPGAAQLSFADGYNDEATLNFPTSFVFPYFGAELQTIRVSTNGLLSFVGSDLIFGSNEPFPDDAEEDVQIAPFFDYLNSGTDGQVWWVHSSDAEGEFVAIQWKNYKFDNHETLPGISLNFEVVLRPSGAFDFRYGPMIGISDGTETTGHSGNNQARADGFSASIGFQDMAAATGYNLSFETVVSGGLSNRSWRFDPTLPADGSVVLTPDDTTTYTVCTHSADHTACEDVTVVVIGPGDVMVSEIMAAPAAPVLDPSGEWFELRNTTRHAIDLNGWEIASDASDTAVTIANGGPLLIGPGEVLVFAQSDAAANGGIVADYVYGTGVSFDHTATDELAIRYGSTQIDRVLWTSGWNMAPGTSLTLDPSFFRPDDEGQNDTSTRWCVSVEDYDGTNLGSPGAIGLGCANPNYDMDVVSTMPFIDIAATGDVLATLNAGDDNIGEVVPGGIGFAMPFFGDTVTDLNVSSNGHILFSTAIEADDVSVYFSSTNPDGFVAPFADDLTGQPGATVTTELLTVGGQQVRIVQWTGWGADTHDGAITFQLQLWQNGDIVMAYKDISWITEDDRQEYHGDNAEIGIKNVAGTAWVEFGDDDIVVYDGLVVHYRKK